MLGSLHSTFRMCSSKLKLQCHRIPKRFLFLWLAVIPMPRVSAQMQKAVVQIWAGRALSKADQRKLDLHTPATS